MSLLLPTLALAFIGCVVVVLTSRRPVPDATAPEQTARRHLRLVRLTALALGAATFVIVALAGSLGRGWLAGPSTGAATCLLIMAVGEHTVPRESAAERTANLAPRGPSSWVRLRAIVAAAVTLASIVGLLAWGCVTASADDTGRAGRAVTWSTTSGSQSHSPWPGGFYAWPLGCALMLLVVAVALALTAVARRAQVNADARAALTDDDLRRSSVATIVRVALLALAFTVAGLGLVMGGATGHVEQGAPAWVTIVHWIARGTLLVAFGAALCAIKPAVRRQERA